MDECNMCHPEMKAPTLATCPGSTLTFQGNFQSQISCVENLCCAFFFFLKPDTEQQQSINMSEKSEIPKTRKAEEEKIRKCVKVCYT